ncbi:phosphoribosylaminoimidazolesuccinocarboxamide synthase [Jiangella alkaliphila]|uniref:Phosphoribosylaminoimidazole-succinocarboxamide synthase n=1 Tax=Jiangella alkaliphila TaxID=419479 RepID=A0A1H2JMN2_9ACTN|nr:phosphoribosylaminoimidazolesuccinocarboxamide synthase [Jiangella alkaliphila]SDU57764.1 phosphoribosylaminoimidazole-succinocarboxamide synthase [Jiangella alkaliphila]
MQLLHKGKVRDVYSDRPGEVILVASDRVSVYDVVLPTPIPDKGKVLTSLSLWWFDQLADVVANHVISADDVPDEWRGRAIRCRQVEIVPVECVARGYLAGSGWTSYQESGTVSGVALPHGLVEGDRLPEPIFTPTTKTPPELGHDEPMTYDEVAALTGDAQAARLRDTTLTLYRRAAELMEQRGVLLVDTKVEFGLAPDGTLLLADEVVTPDSSRFWQASQWAPGRRQVSYDKQVVRDWAQDLGTWDKTPPGPAIPGDVVEKTRAVYIEMYERITGRSWS